MKKFFAKTYSELTPQAPRYYYAKSGGNIISPESAMKVAAYYRGVTYISTQLAKLPWDIKDESNKKINNRVRKLLNVSPNNEMTSFTLKSLLVSTCINKGNAYCEIERDVMGRPLNLWLIPTEAVQADRLEGKLIYRITKGRTDGSDAYLQAKDILHFKNFFTAKDGINGQATIPYAAEAIGISMGADILANSLYANGGIPSGAITVQGRLNEETVHRIKKQWTENNQGRKAGGVAVLEEGAAYSPLNLQPDVMQFLESRKFSVLEIGRFLGLPPTKLFDNESNTFNNIEHSNLEVATDTLDAWARNFEAEVDMKLLGNSRENLRSEMDLQAIFRGDMDTRSQYFNRMMSAGAMTPNEIREAEGKEPYEGGERYYIATNNFTPADRLDEVVTAQISKSQPKPEQKTSKEVDEAVVNYLTKNN